MLPIDRYVQGVVPREVPAEWPAQAVRAQAVAARTYAAFEREAATSYYDICDTELLPGLRRSRATSTRRPTPR